MLSHRALITQSLVLGRAADIGPEYVYLNSGPLFHPATLMQTFATFVAGLTRHIRLEDEVLFPRFERVTGMTSGPTTVMRQDHRLIEKVLAGLTEALDARDRSGFAALHGELLAILGPHNHKEEAVIYPRTDQALDDEARRRLVAELRRFV